MTGFTVSAVVAVGRLVAAGLVVLALAGVARSQTIAACLDQVNAKRASLGLYPLQLDMACQAQAERESVERAQRGITGHLRNGCAPGSAEGVGMRGGSDPYGQQFLTCFHSPKKKRARGFFRGGVGGDDYTRTYTRAGAAVATDGSGTTYYTLILNR